ncbi:MAG: outer membrane beta-barrel protein, partial [Pseudomonadales bacterium]|nr:outer membrane beta-barrel protein [Pseudomonadales bacterium]
FTIGELEGAENFSVTGGYRAFSWLGAELEYGEVFLSTGNGYYYGSNIIIEPFSNWVVTPFISAGLGKMNTETGVQGGNDAGKKSDYKHYGLGLNYYVGFNFLIRSEYRWYTLETDTNDTLDINEWKLGFSTFF